MSNDFRIEKDSMGEMQVPADAYYGAQTARAVENFPISRLRFHRPMIKALGLLKKAAAITNVELGRLDPAIGDAIQKAAQEVIDGKWDHQFVVDIFQTGSGTSTNMNTNEVIANRAIEINGGTMGDKSIHPNDHVNLGQSSNDIIPSAIHLAAMDTMVHQLIPSLNHLFDSLLSKSRDFSSILKIGRTHLQDATPMTLGQEFSGYARQVQLGIDRLWAVEERLGELALGGTAVGTGINTHPDFARKAIQWICDETGLNLTEAQNHFEAQGGRDACVETSGALRTIAASLIKVANDIRFLASGPRCGIGELKMEATQPGSSIMPGKVNPVMSEMLIMVGAQVMGNDATIGFSGAYGNFELNVMLPVIGHNLLESMEILSTGSRVFADRAVRGLQADKERCEGLIEQSLAMCTSLAPVIGYDNAAAIAKDAYNSGRTIREVAREKSGLSEDKLNELLDPASQTRPG
jgi:fumarate hydratase class II